MFSFVDQKNLELPAARALKPSKCNVLWGTDYILMDSNSFMCASGGQEYGKIIEMFAKIWDAQGPRILLHAISIFS